VALGIGEAEQVLIDRELVVVAPSEDGAVR
jgi:hypothetical protein